MNFGNFPYFLEIKSIENDLKSPHSAGPQSARGTVTDGLVVASRWQGVAGELAETTGRAPGNKSGGGAHRGGGAMMGRRGGSVEGGSTVTPASSESCRGGRER
jgi:hypothetical protein